MEEGVDQNVGNGCGGSRWNPTKEQITMLEGLYKQGLRTPSAEQIQQITNRLKDFGHIEGKNVFYWFQNHKARQRQKQKQENISYLNRFLHPTPPLFHAYHHNVVCSPCYSINPANVQPPPPSPTAGLKRARLIPDRIETCQRYNKQMHSISPNPDYIHYHHHQRRQTLDLFPIHPTGLSQSTSTKESPPSKKKNEPFSANSPASHDSNECSIFGNEGYGIDHVQQPFFNFFTGN